MTEPKLTIQIIATIIAFAAVVAACLSAYAAKLAADATRKATQAQIMSSLLDAYASPEMLDAMRLLLDWKSQYGEDFKDEFSRLQLEDDERIKGVDHARRRVSQLFQKIWTMYASGLLDRSVVCSTATRGQVEFYREVVEPLEAATNPNYDRSSFEGLGGLYGIPRAVRFF